jgi:hypothetical protein
MEPVNQRFFFGTFLDLENPNVLNFKNSPDGFIIPTALKDEKYKISTLYFKFDNIVSPEFSIKENNRVDELNAILEENNGKVSKLMVKLLGIEDKFIGTVPNPNELIKYSQQLNEIINKIIERLKSLVKDVTNNNTNSINSMESNTEGYASASSSGQVPPNNNTVSTSNSNNGFSIPADDVYELTPNGQILPPEQNRISINTNNGINNGGSRRIRKNKKARTKRRRSKSFLSKKSKKLS